MCLNMNRVGLHGCSVAQRSGRGRVSAGWQCGSEGEGRRSGVGALAPQLPPPPEPLLLLLLLKMITAHCPCLSRTVSQHS